MSVPNTYHHSILMELARQFANYLVGKPCKVYPIFLDLEIALEPVFAE